MSSDTTRLLPLTTVSTQQPSSPWTSFFLNSAAALATGGCAFYFDTKDGVLNNKVTLCAGMAFLALFNSGVGAVQGFRSRKRDVEITNLNPTNDLVSLQFLLTHREHYAEEQVEKTLSAITAIISKENAAAKIDPTLLPEVDPVLAIPDTTPLQPTLIELNAALILQKQLGIALERSIMLTRCAEIIDALQPILTVHGIHFSRIIAEQSLSPLANKINLIHAYIKALRDPPSEQMHAQQLQAAAHSLAQEQATHAALQRQCQAKQAALQELQKKLDLATEGQTSLRAKLEAAINDKTAQEGEVASLKNQLEEYNTIIAEITAFLESLNSHNPLSELPLKPTTNGFLARLVDQVAQLSRGYLTPPTSPLSVASSLEPMSPF